MKSPFADFIGLEPIYQKKNFLKNSAIELETPFENGEAFPSGIDQNYFEENEMEWECGEDEFTSFMKEEIATVSESEDFYLNDEFEGEQEVEETFPEGEYIEAEYRSRPQSLDFSILSVDNDNIGKTIYINPDLKIKNTPNITGIFIPSSFVASDNFELIIYLHGYKYDTSHGPQACYKDICPSTTIQTYWKSSMFLLREALHEKKRNSILIAPTLGLRSEAGILQLVRGFDLFINQVSRALASEKIIDASYGIGRIVLAAHSGGGMPMQRITMLSDKYTRLIKECWCFDALYGDVSAYWCQWIKADNQRKFYTYYYGTGPAKESNDIAKSCKNTPGRVFPKQSAIRNHWDLVLPYWNERCAATEVSRELEEEAIDEFEAFHPESDQSEEVGIESETAPPDNPASKYHSSKLPAGKNLALDQFKRKVYQRCIKASQAKAASESRIFLDDIPGYTKFPRVDGQLVHPSMLQPLQNLIAEAQHAAAGRGDAIQIKVASGYRPTSLQFATWNRNFYMYYGRAVEGHYITTRGEKKLLKPPFLVKDDFSEKSAQLLSNYIGGLYGSPGYSNHNNGRAVDFAISGKEMRNGKTQYVNLGPNSSQYKQWKDSNFWGWLNQNAARFEFKEYEREPWHWNFTGREKQDSEIEFDEEIIFPETEEPLTRDELLDEGMFQFDTKPTSSSRRSIMLRKDQSPLYYVGIDVTDTVDTVAFGHLWNQKFGWKNLLWELGKDPKNNQRRIDKAHPKLPIARLIRNQDGVTYSDTCLVPQGIDGKGVDKLWAGSSAQSNITDIDAACTFMQSFILNPSADKLTSSLNDSGKGVTADIVYISSHGLSTGDMFGEVAFAESVFALPKSVSLGAQFSGVGWLLLSNCSTLKSYTHEDWLKLMSGPVPLRGIVGFQDTCPLASGSVRVFQSFIKRLAQDKTFIKSWAEALTVRGLEDHWVVVCQEDAVDDKIADYNGRSLKPISAGGKVLMFNKGNPSGIEVVPVPDPFEAFWSKGGTRIVPANRGFAANKLSVGDKVTITVRPPSPGSTFSNGTNISITLVYVRLNHPQPIDITKIFRITSFSGVSKPAAADLNFQNPRGRPDGWEMVVSGTPKEIVLHLECNDLTGLHSNYIFWLDVNISGNSHEFVHKGSIAIS